jgi:phosphatidylinositol alpha-1,6-mannosyltransferase
MIGIVTLLIKFLYGTHYAVYAHGKEVCYFLTPVHKLLYMTILANADFIMANSEFTKLATQKITKTEVIILNPGVEEEAFDHGVNVTEYDGKHIELLTIARLERRKGIDSCIKAVKILENLGYSVKYNVIGTGQYEDYLINLVRENDINDKVIFHGKIIPNERKYPYIKNCDIFLMPSYTISEKQEVEGFGTVYLEANALGKFTIGGDSGGISDAVRHGETGWLVNGENPREIADAILKYLNLSHSAREQIALKCREWAEAHKWDRQVAMFIEYARENAAHKKAHFGF